MYIIFGRDNSHYITGHVNRTAHRENFIEIMKRSWRTTQPFDRLDLSQEGTSVTLKLTSGGG